MWKSISRTLSESLAVSCENKLGIECGLFLEYKGNLILWNLWNRSKEFSDIYLSPFQLFLKI